jgi:hypothetical protein
VNKNTKLDALIDRSSLGEPAVKQLRSRTPPALALAVVRRAEKAAARVIRHDGAHTSSGRIAERQNGKHGGGKNES